MMFGEGQMTLWGGPNDALGRAKDALGRFKLFKEIVLSMQHHSCSAKIVHLLF